MIYIFNVSVALFAGLMMTRLIKACHLKLPDVTAFLIAGLLIGPYFIGRLGIPFIGFKSLEEVDALSVIVDTALGFIAFSIGNEFRLKDLKEIGAQAMITATLGAVFATIMVDITLLVLHFVFGIISVAAAITLGAIASATAPAATLMVVRQYKAHGAVTKLLLPIVAFDDAVGLVLFAVSFGIAKGLNSGTVNIASIALEPLISIVLSLALGGILGIILNAVEKLFYSNTNRLNLSICFVLVSVAMSSLIFHVGSIKISFSPLLTAMMMGSVFCNLCDRSGDIMDRTDKWTSPVLALFFVLSGAELKLGVFTNKAVIIIGIVYIIARCIGKYLGAFTGTKLTKAPTEAVKYLGITLFPQAGVALGMCNEAMDLGAADGTIVRNIVLFGVLIYELVGPVLTKWALTKSGDIDIEAPKGDLSKFNAPSNRLDRIKLEKAIAELSEKEPDKYKEYTAKLGEIFKDALMKNEKK